MISKIIKEKTENKYAILIICVMYTASAEALTLLLKVCQRVWQDGISAKRWVLNSLLQIPHRGCRYFTSFNCLTNFNFFTVN